MNDIARRFATAVHENDSTFLLAVADLNEIISLMRMRGELINPQREGLTRKQILWTFWRALIVNTGGVPPEESFESQGKYNFNEAFSLLGESVFPSPESKLYNKVVKAGYIIDIHYAVGGGWDVDIVDDAYENHITVDKTYLEFNFRSAKVLAKKIQDEEILRLFSPKAN